MKSLSHGLAFGLIALSACASAPAAEAPASVVASAPESAPEAAAVAATTDIAGAMTSDGTKVVCRSMEIIGTRFPKKECKSEAAWKDFDAYTKSNAKDAADRIQRNATSGAVGG
jgi:hypothetical protein